MTLPRHPAHVAIRSGTTINEGLREAHPVDDRLQPTAMMETAADEIRRSRDVTRTMTVRQDAAVATLRPNAPGASGLGFQIRTKA
jgi:hypothetical protein